MACSNPNHWHLSCFTLRGVCARVRACVCVWMCGRNPNLIYSLIFSSAARNIAWHLCLTTDFLSIYLFVYRTFVWCVASAARLPALIIAFTFQFLHFTLSICTITFSHFSSSLRPNTLYKS